MLRGLFNITLSELPLWSKFSRVSNPLSCSSQSSSPFTLLPTDPALLSAFKRPSGASGRVSWMCVCIECELLLKNDPKASVFSNIGVYASTPSPSLNPLPPESDA